MTEATLLALIAALVTLAIVGILAWYGAATYRARRAIVRDAEYRALAERATASQEHLVAQISDLDAVLVRSEERLAAIERAITVVD